MDTQRRDSSLSKEELVDLGREKLALTSTLLREARKILRRDWAQLTPRERSEQSRRVKELELQQQSLLDEIEMNRSV